MEGPILIASDGTTSSEGALRVGIEIARAAGAPGEILAVVEPQPPIMYGAWGEVPPAFDALQSMHTEDLRRAVTEQLEGITPRGDWGISVEAGSPARAIAAYARKRGAALIVAGSGPHTAVERWLRSETSVKIARIADVPVLLVPSTARELPSSVLVGIDFSDFSVASAKAAIPLLRKGGRIYLMHIAGAPYGADALPTIAEYWITYREGAATRLQALASELGAGTDLKFETHLANGDPARELVTAASRFNVDMVAVGSHGQGFLDRVMMGSVATRIIRGARCTVLVTPPKAVAGNIG